MFALGAQQFRSGGLCLERPFPTSNISKPYIDFPKAGFGMLLVNSTKTTWEMGSAVPHNWWILTNT